MKVCIRADASLLIGSGHVMRCLTLAKALSSEGSEVSFICREHSSNLCAFIQEQGFKVNCLPLVLDLLHSSDEKNKYLSWLGATWQQDAKETGAVLKAGSPIDWLIVDHYALDSRWEKSLRHLAQRVMVIDDLADREHDCDLLLDQNYYEQLHMRYDNLVPQHCKKMLGPGYALLRHEFRDAQKILKQRDGTVGRILIFFGGSDISDETSKVLKALYILGEPNVAVDVVVGAANPHREGVQELCSKIPNAQLYIQVQNMAQLMAEADLFVGAGGTTTWERCSVGLPSIVLSLADNQLQVTKDLASYGALISLGRSEEVTVDSLVDALQKALHAPDLLVQIGIRAFSLVQTTINCDSHPVIAAMTRGL